MGRSDKYVKTGCKEKSMSGGCSTAWPIGWKMPNKGFCLDKQVGIKKGKVGGRKWRGVGGTLDGRVVIKCAGERKSWPTWPESKKGIRNR